jgi:hypothetical protein
MCISQHRRFLYWKYAYVRLQSIIPPPRSTFPPGRCTKKLVSIALDLSLHRFGGDAHAQRNELLRVLSGLRCLLVELLDLESLQCGFVGTSVASCCLLVEGQIDGEVAYAGLRMEMGVL